MKRWILRTLLGLVLLVTGFIVGILFQSAARPGVNAVVVEVQNATTKNIEKVVLTHERGRVQICSLGPGQMQTLAFFPGGENAYTLKAYFADGKSVEGLGGYVEPGYAMKETIHEENIKTEYDF